MANKLTSDEFVRLILHHEMRIRGFAATLLQRIQDVDEVVQNACLVAWEKKDTFTYSEQRPDEEFMRWVCTIAHYQVMSFRQKQHKSRLMFDDQLINRLATIQLNSQTILENRRRALTHCIEKLRHRDQELLQRRYRADDSVEQIAEWAGRTASSIYKSLQRIRNTLLACIERLLEQEVSTQ